MHCLGTHLLLELIGCDAVLLNNQDKIKEILLQAAQEAKTTVLDCSFNNFSPQGVSGVILIAESHISIHTWPEFKYAAVDVFTCGDRAMPRKAAEHLIKAFSSKRHQVNVIARGIPSEESDLHENQ